ncbi:hypothetical protein CDIK_3628 [Cucumispora dikerogammari]|nr:hypothetical protein CDIK_3628 [Cucumispora dikerogammari]
MGGVDKYDQMLQYFSKRKSKKCTNQFAVYIIHLIMHNTYILYKTFCKEDDKIKTQPDFRIAFMKFLIPSRDSVNKTTGKNRKTVNKESNIIKNNHLHLMEAYKDNK